VAHHPQPGVKKHIHPFLDLQRLEARLYFGADSACSFIFVNSAALIGFAPSRNHNANSWTLAHNQSVMHLSFFR
jgi:hypothetical protein